MLICTYCVFLNILVKKIIMETVTIPKKEYLELLNLYNLITQKIDFIKHYNDENSEFEKKLMPINTAEKYL